MTLKITCIFLPLALVATSASAEAWLQPQGRGQIITTVSTESADKGYTTSGHTDILTRAWNAETVQVYGEYGVSKKVTLVFKAQAQSLDTAYASGISNGPYELGLRYGLWHSSHSAVSLGISAEGFSRSRRNDFDTSVANGNDVRVSLAAGQSFETRFGSTFVEGSLARHLRQTEADQWRYGLSYGLKPNEKSMWLAQVFGGKTDSRAGRYSQWNVIQASYAHALNQKGDLKAQIGLKYTIAGNNVPAMGGLFIAVWKDF